MKEYNEYLLATASMLDVKTWNEALTWRIADHVKLGEKTGYTGIELWPQRRHPLSQIRAANISDYERAGIKSTHQSPRTALRRQPGLKNLLAAMILPEINDSVKELERVHQLVGNIPSVMFKETPKDVLESSTITQRWIQTDPELNTEWEVQSAEDFVGKVYEKGFTGVVIDTHHLRRPDNNTGSQNVLSNWRETIPQLLRNTKELHIGIGRSDFGDLPIKEIHSEATDFLNNGENNTEVIRMLRLIASLGWRGPVVIEARPSTLKLIDATLTWENYYEKIRNTLFSIFHN